MILAPFALLALAIAAKWASPVLIGSWRIVPGLALLAAATLAGWSTALLQWPAVAALALLAYCAFCAGHPLANAWQRWLFGGATAVLTLALAMHRVPGFDNPLLVANIRFTPDAAPFSQYANFDKGAAGAILLAFLCRRSQSKQEWHKALTTTLAVGVATVLVVIGFALASGHVRFAPKLPAYTATFLVVNVFFTCVAEEAFFRGLVQEKLARVLPRQRAGVYGAVGISAVLFGLAHAGGGLVMIGLATLAGIGYATAYACTQRIEAPILVHFAVNAVHFMGFTYPYVS